MFYVLINNTETNVYFLINNTEAKVYFLINNNEMKVYFNLVMVFHVVCYSIGTKMNLVMILMSR
jgi:hypothetical protein